MDYNDVVSPKRLEDHELSARIKYAFTGPLVRLVNVATHHVPGIAFHPVRISQPLRFVS